MDDNEKAKFAILCQQVANCHIEAELRIQQARTATSDLSINQAVKFETEAEKLLADAKAIIEKLYKIDMGI